jgi:hypothetical protein
MMQVVAEPESEKRWDALFASSLEVLSKLAANAVAELDRGETETLNPDRDFADNEAP